MDLIANVDMANAWNGDQGEQWARQWEHHDRAVAAHQAVLLEAAAVGVADRVIDIGCGNGQLTRDAARAASSGSALGLDLSLPMLTRAREVASAEGVTNVAFEQGDAQVHPFEAVSFDLAVSRFGVMFFADRVAAFTNIGAALRPGGRLAFVVWRPLDENEWQRCIYDALGLGRDLPSPTPGSPGPFGLADPDLTRQSLTEAGFADVDIVPVDLPFWAGADPEDAFGFVRTTGLVRGLSEGLDASQVDQGLAALRATIDASASGPDGVLFGSAVWVITARRA